MNQSNFIQVGISTIIILVLLSGCSSQSEKITPAENIIINEPESVSENSKDLVSETDNTPIDLIVETMSFSWEKDGDSRIVDGSVPFIHRLKDGRVRLYYCNAKGILS